MGFFVCFLHVLLLESWAFCPTQRAELIFLDQSGKKIEETLFAG